MKRPSSLRQKAAPRLRPKTSRKTRVRRKPRRKEKGFPWSSLILVVACLMTGFLVGRWISPPPKPPVVPLSQKIRFVDLALKSRLYMLGLSEKDVISRVSGVQERGKQQWTQTTTKIQLSKPISFRRLHEELNREIGSLGKDFLVVKKGDRDGVLQLQVLVQDFVAHNLFIFRPEVAKPEVPLKGRIAIIIDDLGPSKKVAMDLLNIEAPLSFSVFPFAPYSREFAKRASKKGRDVLLHLPMEPKGYPTQDPGSGGLLTTMAERELLSQIEKDLSAVPNVKGVNNHMGSKFTEDPELMRIVLEDINRRGLFFLDSRTTSKTVGFKVAQEIGIQTGQRDVFLDNERDVSKIKARIAELIDISHRNGAAIGIGHPRPETIQALREVLPSLRQNGVELVPVSSLLE